MSSNESFLEKLLTCHEAIGYTPLKDEPNYSFLPLAPTIHLPVDASVDPIEIGRALTEQFADTKVCVYVPGTRFDSYGTRHGRGGGWYDRFLAVLPADWIRIGICTESAFSLVHLKRAAWDQPVDWVCVQRQDTVDYYETRDGVIHENQSNAST